MESRLSQQKPDPAIKKSIAQARSGARGAGRIQGFMVAASLTATLLGWSFFSQQDAQVAATAQLADTTPAVVSVQQAATTPQPAITEVPTQVAIALPTQTPAVVAITQSSR